MPRLLQAAECAGVMFLTASEPAGTDKRGVRLAEELANACTEIEQADELPLAVVLEGGGPAYFFQAPDDAAGCDALVPALATATAALGRLSPPTIAAIGGDAIGPAWELALGCDLRLAADHVRVGSPEVRFGRLPAAGGTQRLTRIAGPAVALRLLLLAEILDASTAQGLGLLHRIVPADSLGTSLEAVLDGMRASAPIALSYVRETVRAATNLPLADGLRLEADLAVLLQTTSDRAEGLGAFLARRSPRFEGR